MKPLKFLFFLLSASFFVACSNDDNGNNQPTEEELIAQQIEEVRAATSSFSNIEAAISAGWDTDLSGCVEHPTEGGMGHHYARLEFMDGRVNHLEPQVLLYAVDDNHQMELLGVEYIVPFAVLPETEPAPELFGHAFHQNHEQQIWALHVWTQRDNPNGMFEDWNPTVSCDNWIAMLLDEVRSETASYHDFSTAETAGWNNPLSGCVEHPTEGGMGIHYGRMEYFDGRVNHLEPQVLLYLPIENNDMEFLGVEYIVPFAIHPEDAAPPMLFGQHFHQNHEQGFWALHVWTERDNPSGIFYDWNPTVSCQ